MLELGEGMKLRNGSDMAFLQMVFCALCLMIWFATTCAARSDSLDVKFMKAVHENHIRQARQLLKNGANVNVLDGATSLTALGFASKNNLPEMAGLLLDNGADVNLPATPLGKSALGWAAADGHIGVARVLVSYGANINSHDESPEGFTPLIHATSNGRYDVVKFFLAEGANVDVTDNSGWTALMFASRNRDMNLVKLLLAKGANVHIRNSNGQTAHEVACELKPLPERFGNHKDNKRAIMKLLKVFATKKTIVHK
jgi:ankyrin repeat protein